MAGDDQTSWPSPGSRLRLSHHELLVSCQASRLPAYVDAIAIPSHRSADHLAFGAELSQQLRCPILVLSSQASVASEVGSKLSPADGVAVSAAPGALDHWLKIKTLAWTPGRAFTYADRAVKRNVALLVARMMRWRRVLFLDDDVSGIGYRTVWEAASYARWSGLRAVSWPTVRHPDNSVACHALRSVGGRQGVFATGGSLMVYVPGWLPFFPAVYNEDWLFMYDLLARRKIGRVGRMTQNFYQPFENRERAIREEFGDVLGEGLMALLHEGRSVHVACLSAYWRSVIDERRAMLEHIKRQLWRRRDDGHTQTSDGYDLAQVVMAIEAAHEELDGITPEDLAEFTSAWRHDLYLWNSRLPLLPKFTRIEDALNWLGLYDVYHSNGG